VFLSKNHLPIVVLYEESISCIYDARKVFLAIIQLFLFQYTHPLPESMKNFCGSAMHLYDSYFPCQKKKTRKMAINLPHRLHTGPTYFEKFMTLKLFFITGRVKKCIFVIFEPEKFFWDRKIFLLKMIFIGVILCEESIARIPES
jgi:hypothetical protein